MLMGSSADVEGWDEGSIDGVSSSAMIDCIPEASKSPSLYKKSRGIIVKAPVPMLIEEA